MPQQYRCKYCHVPVSPNAEHVCESTAGVHDEDDFLELTPTTSVAHGNRQDALDNQDDHEQEFD